MNAKQMEPPITRRSQVVSRWYRWIFIGMMIVINAKAPQVSGVTDLCAQSLVERREIGVPFVSQFSL